MHSQVLAHERAEPGGVFLEHRVALGLQLPDRGVEVHRGPQHDGVEDQAEDAELVFQPAFVVVEQFALLAVADGAGQVVTAFLEVADVLNIAAEVSSASM